MKVLNRFLVFLLLMGFVLTPLLAVDSDDVEDIDIYDEDVVQLVDFDFDGFQKKASKAYQTGEYEDAARFYLILAQHDVNNSGTIYNLACCYGLLSEEKLAAEFLDIAFNSGFTNIDHIRNDKDFDKVRGTEIFDKLVDELEKIHTEKESELGDTFLIDTKTYLKGRIRFPENYDPARSYPLLVGLHGLGHYPDGFIKLWDRFENPDFIFVTPQAPYPYVGGKDIGYAWALWGYGEDAKNLSYEMTEDYVAKVVNDLKKEYKIDDVYLMGFSQGCGFTYIASMKYPELFDGLICFGGWLTTDWIDDEQLKKAKSLRVFISHGNEDSVVEFENGTNARDKLIEMGYDVTFVEFDGGHTVDKDALQTAENWMKE